MPSYVDRDEAMEAVTRNGLLLEYASAELKGDHDVVLAAVTDDGQALQYASAELKGDHDVVLAAVTDDGLALKHASEELQDNDHLAACAMKEDYEAMQFASNRIRILCEDPAVADEFIREQNPTPPRESRWGGSLERRQGLLTPPGHPDVYKRR
jgi:hypothetical protein